MPAQNVVQQRPVDFSLRQELLDSGQVLMAAHARSDGNDIFRRKDFCRHAVIFNPLCFAHSFLSQPGRGEELNRKIFDDQMLALYVPTFRLQMRIDRRDACAQRFVARDKNDVRVVGREWFGVVDCRECSAKRVIFD